MSAHEHDGSNPCSACGVTFDVHEALSPACEGEAKQEALDAEVASHIRFHDGLSEERER